MTVDLNPPALPVRPGVQFAGYYRVAFEQDALGGDFYDVLGDADPTGEWSLVVGDVCGKGVEAAVLTGKVRQIVRTAVMVDRDPAAVLSLTNRVLTQDTWGRFVTVVCARGSRVGDRLRLDIATAGHPGPFVVRADGSVEEVQVSGAVLGVFEETTHTTTRVELAVGETCLFFTDGVAEAPGRRARFGEERIRAVLEATGAQPAAVQVESLAIAVSTHLRDRFHDDIAVLAVQCVDPR